MIRGVEAFLENLAEVISYCLSFIELKRTIITIVVDHGIRIGSWIKDISQIGPILDKVLDTIADHLQRWL